MDESRFIWGVRMKREGSSIVLFKKFTHAVFLRPKSIVKKLNFLLFRLRTEDLQLERHVWNVYAALTSQRIRHDVCVCMT